MLITKLKILLFVVIGVLMTFLVQSAPCQVSFSRHVLDSNLTSAFTVYAADINGNGRNDVIAGAQSGKLVLYVNNGNGNFTKKVIENNYGTIWSVKVFDVNRDGRLDIIGAISKAENIAWWKNNGGTSFTRYVVDDDFVSAEDVAAGDLDGDGDIDLVGFGWNDSNPTRWYENNGSEHFTKHTLQTNFIWAHYVNIADFNGDGYLDIVGTAASERDIAWWRNSGSGSFNVITIDSHFSGAYCAEPMDLDQDGDLDVVAAAHAINSLAWYENNGNGGFTKHWITKSFMKPHDTYGGDIDQDGDMDFVATAREASEIAWWENNGNESFTKHTITSSIGEPQTAFLADLDNDGDLDVIGESRTDDYVVWWENELTAERVSKPDTPTGPTSGIIGESLSYSTGGASSNMGHDVEYQFDWGDGDYSSWGSSTQSHSYSTAGSYNVRARARCQIHTSVVSSWSNSLTVDIVAETVSVPNVPSGPDNGVEEQNLNFSTGGAESNYGHPVEYQFDWGDGNQSSWGTANRSHSYQNVGSYQVRARARCQEHTDVVSNWSSGHNVEISPRQYSVAGTVSYYSNAEPIENVNIDVAGDVSRNYLTNGGGNFSFDLENNKSIELTPSKPQNEDVGPYDISMYDAALTARFALSLEQLDDNQQLAADADRNGQIYTFDAALIAQHAVGLEDMPGSHVGEWLFLPTSRNISNINSNHSSEDFIGIIIGNVHGGWTPPGNLRKNVAQNNNIKKFVNYIQEESKAIFVFNNDPSLKTISADIEIDYDSKTFEFDHYEIPELSNGINIVENNRSGSLKIGLYSINPLTNGGELIKLIYQIKGEGNKSSSIEIKKYLLNNQLVFSGSAEFSSFQNHNKISNYELKQNYPNPFNSSTNIQFVMPDDGFVTLKIFNLSGQVICSLVNENFKAGVHVVNWHGHNDSGQRVVSGVYFYKIKINDFEESKKLLILE